MYVFYVVFGGPRLRKHVIYVVLWLGTSKNMGLAAFWCPKTQPNRGFGGSAASKPRILRGFGGSGTLVFEARETRNLVIYAVLEHFGLKNRSPEASGRLPEAPGSPRRPPGGSQEAPEAGNTVKHTYLHVFYEVSGRPRICKAGLREGNHGAFWPGGNLQEGG